MFKDQQKNFILQQGFAEPADSACPLQYKALQFQPWIVGATVITATILRSPLIFFTLAGLLFWGALFPKLNLFEAIYNITFGKKPGAMKLTPAPGPRRFSQALAGTFAAALALCLNYGGGKAFWIMDGFFLLAITLLVSGGLCFGSLVFHTLRGRFGFAKHTLPWA